MRCLIKMFKDLKFTYKLNTTDGRVDIYGVNLGPMVTCLSVFGNIQIWKSAIHSTYIGLPVPTYYYIVEVEVTHNTKKYEHGKGKILEQHHFGRNWKEGVESLVEKYNSLLLGLTTDN